MRRVEHHAAMNYDAVPGFMANLRMQESITARALEFAILTAARTGEVLGATFDEIDSNAGMWTVPAARMKGGREHRVPLSPRALKIAKDMAGRGNGAFVFPGGNLGPAALGKGTRQDTASAENRERHRSWLPKRISRLVCRTNELSRRGRRNGPCPYSRRQGRGGLSPW